ncbi:YabP/YqfC family sporulation protein [Candidatus Stoquefichus massiliensis]|uniref:YabP/YqfC family sporulation protein n=1 Tax=Candidatus Stoquefichus massiliensis TaxID=1470350 RepID=UPI0004806DB6|nr:YabP/YqfC family sporulation protein [Candidatus Stoquefichus massiliensis]
MLLIDHHKIYVKDYLEILIMNQQFFKIKMNGYCLNVRGEALEIYYYDHNEIRLNGHVKVIEYDEYRV